MLALLLVGCVQMPDNCETMRIKLPNKKFTFKTKTSKGKTIVKLKLDLSKAPKGQKRQGLRGIDLLVHLKPIKGSYPSGRIKVGDSWAFKGDVLEIEIPYDKEQNAFRVFVQRNKCSGRAKKGEICTLIIEHDKGDPLEVKEITGGLVMVGDIEM